jgi:ribosome biogenesis GTPase
LNENKRNTLWQEWKTHHPDGEFTLARVMEQKHHTYYCVPTGAPLDGAGAYIAAKVTAKLRDQAQGPEDFPVVGDWVILDRTVQLENGAQALLDFLPRSGVLRRAAAGTETKQQLLAANLDFLLLVFGLDGARNFVPALLERSLTTAWDSGAKPIIVLNKADCAEEDARREALETAQSLAFGVPVILLSAKNGEGLQDLAEHLTAGTVTALLGKSGVGKSAIVNALAGNMGLAQEGRQRYGDRQGRHTTTSSRIYPLPSGALIADLPGLRELKVWGDQENLAETFPEIAALALNCRFRDCSHQAEPGCAVQGALEDGSLEPRRFASFQKLQKELEYLHRRQDQKAAAVEKAKWKQIHKINRHFKKPGR